MQLTLTQSLPLAGAVMVTTPQEVTEIVNKLQQQKKRSVLLFVERQGDPRFAALRLTK